MGRIGGGGGRRRREDRMRTMFRGRRWGMGSRGGDWRRR